MKFKRQKIPESVLVFIKHRHYCCTCYYIYGFVGIYFMFTAFVGTLFPGKEEAAYANFRLWESVGYIIAYVISPYLRISEKTYFLLVMMFVGVFFYLIVEYKQSKNRDDLVINKMNSSELKHNKKCYKGCDNMAFEN